MMLRLMRAEAASNAQGKLFELTTHPLMSNLMSGGRPRALEMSRATADTVIGGGRPYAKAKPTRTPQRIHEVDRSLQI